ncbi:MAG: hypothetical protein U0Q55_02805 [Vicinamibacterales bacterium]
MFAIARRTAGLRPRLLRPSVVLLWVALSVAASACGPSQPVLLRLMEARRLAAVLHTSFTRANEASERAVLADTDDVSAAAAREAAEATAAAGRTLSELEALVQTLGYSGEVETLKTFRGRFDEFQKLDGEILALAVENTNLKAQRLSFGAARELGEQIATELAPLRAAQAGEQAAPAEAIRANVFALLFLQARHNAEAQDAEMSRLEAQANALIVETRVRFTELSGKGNAAQVLAAVSLFNRLVATHDEVIALSRRNTNVRSLALTLGRKRVVVADCEAELAALQQALAGHGSQATR